MVWVWYVQLGAFIHKGKIFNVIWPDDIEKYDIMTDLQTIYGASQRYIANIKFGIPSCNLCVWMATLLVE